MEPLLSPDWYRVAQMRPRLRAGVRVSAQQVRGELWYLLTDPMSGRHHRFNDIAYRLISTCDGVRTLDDVWAARRAADGEDVPTQGEIVRVVSQAFAANLFVGDVAPDVAAMVKAQLRGERLRARAALNPLALKVPLWDPDAFLAARIRRYRWLFGLGATRLVIVIVGIGALLLTINASEYISFSRDHVGSGRMLFILWLVFPLVKALHEGAHAMAVRAFGGEVHEIGVTLLLLTPVPYVDASASIEFSSKRQRVAVASVGVAVELVLASLALLLWLVLEQGLMREIAFAFVLVGGMSTLAVNGNPLLQFDGYHMMCDQFELPNLARRSQQYWIYLAKRFVLRVQGVHFSDHSRGALPWLVIYAPLSWLYRTFLLGLLSVWLAGQSGPLGLASLVLLLWLCLLQPCLTTLHYIARSSELHSSRMRSAIITLFGAAALGWSLFYVRVPNQTRAPGIVWLQDEALVRLGTDGFVQQFMAADGDEVVAGQPLLRLSNDQLQADMQQVQSQMARLDVERATSFDSAPLRSSLASDERSRLRAEQLRLQQRADQLLVRAKVAGRLVVGPRLGIIGRYLPQGQLVAQILTHAPPLVRVLVRNEDIAQVRDDSKYVHVTLAHAHGLLAKGRITAAVPLASATLPSAALGDTAGGSLALDLNDKTGLTALERRFQIDIRLDNEVDARVGARALVTFTHADTSAARLLREFIRRSFLRYFER